MFVFHPFLTESTLPFGKRYRRDILVLLDARRLYERVCNQGRLRKLWERMTRGERHLLNLTGIAAVSNIRTRYYLGRRTVLIEQIRGSESRSTDFDASFYPRRSHNQERWVSIAAARMMGLVLPPVELIQVGDSYFVRDGHHRVSVARALGEQYIEAEVTVWQVSGSLAGERSVSSILSRPAAVAPLLAVRNLDQ